LIRLIITTVINKREKVQFSLGLINHNDMKRYRGSEDTAQPLLTSALDKSEWSASRPGPFTPGKEPTIPTE
jgi:hypothetical protein